MESKAARIVRYTILAVFLCLLWGGALLAGGWLLAALWHGGPNPPYVSTFPVVALVLGYAGYSAWRGFQGGGAFDLLSVMLFLVLLSGYQLVGAAMQAISPPTDLRLHVLLPPGLAIPLLCALWGLAITGAVLARRERRRRMRLVSAG